MSDVTIVLDLGKEIKGSCTLEDVRFTEKITVSAFYLGAQKFAVPTASNSARSTGDTQINEITLSKSVDSATSELYARCVGGLKFDEGKLYVCRKVGNKYIATWLYVLTDPLVTNISTSYGGGGGGRQFFFEFHQHRGDIRPRRN